MKQGSTIILRGVVILIGLIVLGLCVFGVPTALRSDNVGFYRPILWGLYAPAIPFFVALYQALKLLDYIDNNTVFSELSVRSLQYIKYCGLVIAGLFAAGSPNIYQARAV